MTKARGKTNITKKIILAVMLILFGAVIYIMVNYTDMTNPATAVNSLITGIGLVFSLILYLCCTTGNYNSDKIQKQHFIALIITIYLIFIVQNIVNVNEAKPEKKTLLFVLYTILYLLMAVYWIAFMFYQKDKYPGRKSDKLFYTIFIVMGIVYIIAILMNIVTSTQFYITDEGTFSLGTAPVDIITVLFFMLYAIYIFTSKGTQKVKWTLSSYAVFPAAINLLFYIVEEDAFMWAISNSLFPVFYLIPLYLIFFNIYIKQDRDLLKRNMELAESQTKALALRMTPHFIANTLSSIAALCDESPKEAKKLTIKFAKYLRENYVDEDGDSIITFKDELGQLENYLSIEQVRFPNLKTEYDIKAVNFRLPCLTVQPLVENAVRHGIHKKEGCKGTVKIASYETEDSYVITITDDGVGFDKIPDDGKQHFGISNARNRLNILCGGTLTVESEVGRGTVSTVRIPKKS